MADTVTILGARGSVPVSGAEYVRYGGATSSYLIHIGGEALILDAGTGLMRLPREVLAAPEINLILSHPHADHLLGLGMLAYSGRLTVYAKSRLGLSGREQAERLYSPPLWPVSPRAEYRELESAMRIGALKIETIEGVHPGGVSLIKIAGGGKTVVYATDATVTGDSLAQFAAGCDLLLCDGQYTAAEWETYKAYGHSTWEMAAEAAQKAGARKLRIVHHSPARTDAELDRLSERLKAIDPLWDFAREGEEVHI